MMQYFQSRFFLWVPLLAICLLATIPFRAYDTVWYVQTSAAALLTAILILHHAKRPTLHDFEPIATLGRISFSIYLLHIVVIDYFPTGRFNAQLGTVLAFAMIIGASLLTYRWIEQPAIALSKRLAPFSPRGPLRSAVPVALQPLPSQAE
jgi:peptidoglycan/LPS O-acetylase OafA/YrhL